MTEVHHISGHGEDSGVVYSEMQVAIDCKILKRQLLANSKESISYSQFSIHSLGSLGLDSHMSKLRQQMRQMVVFLWLFGLESVCF